MNDLFASNRQIRRLLLPLAIGVAGAAGGPLVPASDAATTSKPVSIAAYDVTYTGAYALHATEADPGVMFATRDASITWTSRSAASLILHAGPTAQTDVVTTGAPVTDVAGTYHETVFAEQTIIQDCTLSQSGPPGTGIIGTSTDQAGAITVDVQPFDHISTDLACTHPVPAVGVAFLGRDFSARFTIPASQLGQATITVPVANDASLPCPGYALTRSCDVSWAGQVTLTRTLDPTLPDDLIVPLVPPAGSTATPAGGSPTAPVVSGRKPGSGSTSASDLSDLIVPLVDPLVTFTANDLALIFRAVCHGGCTGVATIRVGGTARRQMAVATSKGLAFRVPAGATTHAVRLVLPREIRRVLRRAGSGKLVLVLRDRHSGHITRAVRQLVVRR